MTIARAFWGRGFYLDFYTSPLTTESLLGLGLRDRDRARARARAKVRARAKPRAKVGLGLGLVRAEETGKARISCVLRARART